MLSDPTTAVNLTQNGGKNGKNDWKSINHQSMDLYKYVSHTHDT